MSLAASPSFRQDVSSLWRYFASLVLQSHLAEWSRLTTWLYFGLVQVALQSVFGCFTKLSPRCLFSLKVLCKSCFTKSFGRVVEADRMVSLWHQWPLFGRVSTCGEWKQKPAPLRIGLKFLLTWGSISWHCGDPGGLGHKNKQKQWCASAANR